VGACGRQGEELGVQGNQILMTDTIVNSNDKKKIAKSLFNHMQSPSVKRDTTKQTNKQ
jgi:hypothetical protein